MNIPGQLAAHTPHCSITTRWGWKAWKGPGVGGLGSAGRRWVLNPPPVDAASRPRGAAASCKNPADWTRAPDLCSGVGGAEMLPWRVDCGTASQKSGGFVRGRSSWQVFISGICDCLAVKCSTAQVTSLTC
jgi:hypothetical protein